MVVLAVWLKFAFCPECPGYVHCPPKSSYTVYTKQCMYKIENLKGKKIKRAWVKAGYCFRYLYKCSSSNSSCLYHKLYTENPEKAALIHYYWIYCSLYSKGGNAADKKHFCQLIWICLDLYSQKRSKSHSFSQLFNIQTFLSATLLKLQLQLYHSKFLIPAVLFWSLEYNHFHNHSEC